MYVRSNSYNDLGLLKKIVNLFNEFLT
eukprot:SAG11_NODE_19957_length_455_cov_1.294944_1_plen_26_part_01